MLSHGREYDKFSVIERVDVIGHKDSRMMRSMNMSNRHLVILHGWSDTSDSFRHLARHLASALQSTEVWLIALGSYLLMSDELRFDDLQKAMNRAWSDRDLPRQPYSVDAVVHSTGSLVIRKWLDHNFEPDRSPIKHLVMLAPANFGSPLAHKWRSLFGRAYWGSSIVK